MTDLRLSLAVPTLGGALALGIVAAIVPELPPLEILGGDAPAYARMADQPLEPVSAAPGAQRLLTPLVVAALPFSTATGFLVLSVLSTLGASVVVALICRRLGLSLGVQTSAAVLTASSYVGVHGVFNPYYVDPELMLLAALVLLFTLERRALAFAVTAAVAMAVKEIAITFALLPYLVWRPAGALWVPRLALRTFLLAIPLIVVAVAVHGFAPELAGVADDARQQFFTNFDPIAGLRRGFLTAVANPLLALFGAAWLLWPLGLLRGPSDLRRAHLWALVAFVPLALGSWERTMGVFVPLVIPTALWVIRAASPGVLAAFTVGSFSISGIAGAITIGDDATTPAFKAALVAPGLAVAVAALCYELSRRRRQGTPALSGRVAPADPG